MSKLSLFSQIGMIVIAITIVIMYIKPTVASIRSTEETTAMYVAEADKVKAVDDLLASKVSEVDSVPPADLAALNRYMPDSFDEVAVLKDLSAIFTALKIPLESLSVSGTPAPAADDVSGNKLVAHSFTVSAKMSYDVLKKLLHAIEVNDYLIQIDSLKALPNDTGELGVTLVLRTFSRNSIVAAEVEQPVDEIIE